jgi:hypothetical protein
MDRFFDIWQWVKAISGIVFATCLVLYVIRCVSEVHILSFLQFQLYLDKLLKAIFS